MTKGELIKAMEDFPDDMPVLYPETPRGIRADHVSIDSVTEICPTQTDTSENYLLIS